MRHLHTSGFRSHHATLHEKLDLLMFANVANFWEIQICTYSKFQGGKCHICSLRKAAKQELKKKRLAEVQKLYGVEGNCIKRILSMGKQDP